MSEQTRCVEAKRQVRGELETYHLISEHQHSLEGELSLAVIEQVLQTGSQQINNHDIVVTLDAKPVNVRDSDLITLLS